MLGWIKCFALIAGTLWFFRWLRTYESPYHYRRPRHRVEVETL